MTYSVDLDIDHNYQPINLLKNCQRLDVSLQLVAESGPGGSNPVYRFHSNDKSELLRLLEKFDMKEYTENIKFRM